MRKQIASIALFMSLSITMGQHSSQCSSANENQEDCILHHISDKLEQIPVVLDRKIDRAVQKIAENFQEVTRESNCNCGESQSNCPTNPDLSCPETPDDALTDDSLPENCLDLYIEGHRISGIYSVYEPIAISPFRSNYRRTITVFCDMDEDANESKGWMLIQRRQDGSVSFNRTWAEYRGGFGDVAGEHWLGNDNLAIITGGNSKPYELRVDLEDWDGEKRHARYSSFKIQSEAFKYRLALGTYSGDAGNSIINDMQFSTPDMDNDVAWYRECAKSEYWAGWWYNDCGYAFLNNPYHSNSTARVNNGISWHHWHGNQYSLKKVQMKIRPLLDWEV